MQNGILFIYHEYCFECMNGGLYYIIQCIDVDVNEIPPAFLCCVRSLRSEKTSHLAGKHPIPPHSLSPFHSKSANSIFTSTKPIPNLTSSI